MNKASASAVAEHLRFLLKEKQMEVILEMTFVSLSTGYEKSIIYELTTYVTLLTRCSCGASAARSKWSGCVGLITVIMTDRVDYLIII